MKSIIGIREDENGEQVSWHALGVGVSDYVTLCGMDGDDSVVDQFGTVEPKRGQKIDCQQCRQMWDGVMSLRLQRRNFVR